MKLTAEILKNYNLEYENQYHKIDNKEKIITTFFKGFAKYLNSDLKSEGCSEDPQKLLIGLSKIGAYSLHIYHGPIPWGYEEELRYYLEFYLTEKFKLKSFNGFHLHFLKKNTAGSFATIKLSWNKDVTGTSKFTSVPSKMTKKARKVILSSAQGTFKSKSNDLNNREKIGRRYQRYPRYQRYGRHHRNPKNHWDLKDHEKVNHLAQNHKLLQKRLEKLESQIKLIKNSQINVEIIDKLENNNN